MSCVSPKSIGQALGLFAFRSDWLMTKAMALDRNTGLWGTWSQHSRPGLRPPHPVAMPALARPVRWGFSLLRKKLMGAEARLS
ncbi:hypothetical protein D0469_18320 [Peribacillus saganii]|uniref:Uncharacterized protein n=1 Tax=Peribacillus saganii TaxID=2303992 RepID=A0A372LEB0_9BACI|nr:hypothetical protein D0469_18320 [Peribacillus saganii]